MNNADAFRAQFGIYATELWSMSEEQLFAWLKAEATQGDAISRQAAIDELIKMLLDCFQSDEELVDAVATTIKELPSAQPDIVRCKDCKHAEKWTDEDGDFIACHIKDDICDFIDYVEPMHYCGYAERQED